MECVIKTLNDDLEGKYTCPVCKCYYYLKEEKMATKSERRLITLTYENNGDVYAESRTFSNEDLLKHMREMAEEYFSETTHEKPFAICAIDFDKQVSTIYEYTCERTVKIECTMY